MHALVVGGGSVGQVLAYHLQLAGARVGVLLRDEASAAGRLEFVLYPLNARHSRTRPIRFSSFDLLTRPTSAAGGAWDQIYLCVPSTALNDDLLAGIQEHSGPATIVKLQPGLRDRRAYAAHFRDGQLVTGMLSLISYSAPLPGEPIAEPGTAFWFPPILPSLFGGPQGRSQQVVQTLRAGGFPARNHPDVERLLAHALATEAPLTAGLECARWSIGEFTRGRWFGVACQAVREARVIVSRSQGSRPPRIMQLFGRVTLRLAIELLPKRRPIPLEAYLRRHFTKLRAQSRQHLDQYIEEGTERGLPVASLRELRRGLEAEI